MLNDTNVSDFIPIPSSPIQVSAYTPPQYDGTTLIILSAIAILLYFIVRHSFIKMFKIRVTPSGEVFINKKSIGITEQIEFNLDTKSQLSTRIKGDISKIVTLIEELPSNSRKFAITITPDGKEHKGTIEFKKKAKKVLRYKMKKSMAISIKI